METETSTTMEQLQKSIKTFGSLTMAAESREKFYKYNDALMQSIYSIIDDDDFPVEEKQKAFETSLDQYADAMKKLFPKLITKTPEPEPESCKVGKTGEESFDYIEEK